jgi:transcriptional regulator with XRE-family HTH domain
MRESSQSERRVSQLQHWRLAYGFSRDRLAAVAGITPRCLYGLEVEGRRPRYATAMALQVALGIDAGTLFPDYDDVAPAGNGREVTTSTAGLNPDDGVGS